MSPGLAISTPNSRAGSKSLRLCVTMALALPFTAASRTISSSASRSIGRTRKETSTASAIVAKLLMTASTSARVCPVTSRVSLLLRTASYSKNNAVEHSGTTLPLSASLSSALLAPSRLRNAATMTFVSRTNRTTSGYLTSNKMSNTSWRWQPATSVYALLHLPGTNPHAATRESAQRTRTPDTGHRAPGTAKVCYERGLTNPLVESARIALSSVFHDDPPQNLWS